MKEMRFGADLLLSERAGRSMYDPDRLPFAPGRDRCRDHGAGYRPEHITNLVQTNEFVDCRNGRLRVGLHILDQQFDLASMNLAMGCIQGHFRAALAGTAESDEPAAKASPKYFHFRLLRLLFRHDPARPGHDVERACQPTRLLLGVA